MKILDHIRQVRAETAKRRVPPAASGPWRECTPDDRKCNRGYGDHEE